MSTKLDPSAALYMVFRKRGWYLPEEALGSGKKCMVHGQENSKVKTPKRQPVIYADSQAASRKRPGLKGPSAFVSASLRQH